MARIEPRIMWDDHTKLGTTALSGSLAEDGFPVERVLDSRRSKTFRTKAGWNIALDINDRIDITEGVSGDASAILTPGNYATGALMATEVATQINAVATDNTWTCTYDSPTQKFTIGHDNVQTGGLEFATGSNAFRSAAESFGFNVQDKTGSSSYVGDHPTLHSVEYITFDFGIARSVAFAGALTSGNSSSIVGILASAVANFASLTLSAIVAGGDTADPGKRAVFLGSLQTNRYFRFAFKDLVPTLSFFEIGAVFLGPTSTFLRAYDLNTAHPREELSELEVGDFGAVFTDVKPSRRRFQYGFRELPDIDHDEWELIANSKRVGGHLWYGADPQNSPVIKTLYGYVDDPGIGFTHLRSNVSVAASPQGEWNVTFPFAEAVS